MHQCLMAETKCASLSYKWMDGIEWTIAFEREMMQETAVRVNNIEWHLKLLIPPFPIIDRFI